MALCWFRAIQELSAIPASSTQKGQFVKGRKGEETLPLRIQHEREKLNKCNFFRAVFFLSYNFISVQNSDSLHFWWLKGSENAELSQAFDSNYPDNKQGPCAIALFTSIPGFSEEMVEITLTLGLQHKTP